MWNVKCQPRKGKWILSNRHEKRLAWRDGKDKRAPVVTAAVVARPETRPHRQLGKNEPQAFCAHCNEWIPMEWRPSKERGKTAETWFQCKYCGGRDLTLRYLSPGEAVRRNALRCKPSPPRDSICMAKRAKTGVITRQRARECHRRASVSRTDTRASSKGRGESQKWFEAGQQPCEP